MHKMCSILEIVSLGFSLRIEISKSKNMNIFKAHDIYCQLLPKSLYYFSHYGVYNFTTSAFLLFDLNQIFAAAKAVELENNRENTKSLSWHGVSEGF